jgi:hypothetical protein
MTNAAALDDRWASVLDALEDEARHAQQLAQGESRGLALGAPVRAASGASGAPFAPPVDLGPLPAALAARARAVAAALERAGTALAAALEAVRAELGRLDRPGGTDEHAGERHGGFDTRA